MAYSVLLYNKAREFLMSLSNNELEERRPVLPSGAQPTFWMFSLPTAPKNNFDEVYPGIVLGDHQLARDKAKLQAIGITHVVNCAQGAKMNQINTNDQYYSLVGIQFLGIKAIDTSTFNMMPHFKPVSEFIDKAIKNGGKVYVHCTNGINRSATFVLSCLMLERNMELMDAIRTVRQKREILPNDGFLKQLCELNKKIYGDKDAPSEKDKDKDDAGPPKKMAKTSKS